MRFAWEQLLEKKGRAYPKRILVPSPRAAFSLVELLITLALMIIMVVLFFGFGSRSHQGKMKVECQRNLTRIHVALEIFARDNGGAFPFVPQAPSSEVPLSLLVPRCTIDTPAFICPGSKDQPLPEGMPFAQRRISYAYFMGQQPETASAPLMSDRLIDTAAKQQGAVIFSTTGKPPGNNHHKYGGNFLFADGRTESVPTRVPFPLVWTQSVVLLNPKP